MSTVSKTIKFSWQINQCDRSLKARDKLKGNEFNE